MASSAGEVAAATAAAAVAEAAAKSIEYEYDDDEFDMEAEMLRREFREASLLANGGGAACVPATVAVNPAVLEPSSQTQVDLTADRRPTASVAAQPPHQLQVADHSSGGSSSVDSRVAEMAYAYGNQCEYTVEDVASKHGGKGQSIAAVKSAAASTATVNNNNNDEEYLVEQRLLGNGVDGSGGGGHTGGNGEESPPPNADNCSPGDRGLATTVATAATAAVSQ